MRWWLEEVVDDDVGSGEQSSFFIARVVSKVGGLRTKRLVSLKVIATNNAHPFASIKCESSKPHCCGGDAAGGECNQAIFDAVNLDQVLGDSPALRIESVGLADPPQKGDGARVAEVVLDALEHILFGFFDLLGGARLGGKVEHHLDGRCANLLVF